MTVYSFISSLMSYVFTTVIYLFIFSVIYLIYIDIKNMNKNEETVSDEITALLCTVKSEEAVKCNMKKKYRINGEPTVIGRGKECDIRINNAFLSEEHFQIWFEDGVWYIGDMGSKNGTKLNGTKLKKIRTLKENDEISFGGLDVVFHEE